MPSPDSTAPAPVDWEDIRRRLAGLGDRLEAAAETGSHQRRLLLRERARALAQPLQTAAPTGPLVEFVEFQLAEERYGIESGYIREVVAVPEITPLPTVPPFVLGIFNLRGQITSVLDLKQILGLPAKGFSDINPVLVLHSETVEFGLLVDGILGTQQCPVESLQPPLGTGAETGRYVKGITPDRIILLDAGRMLSDRQWVVEEEVQD